MSSQVIGNKKWLVWTNTNTRIKNAYANKRKLSKYLTLLIKGSF